MNHLPQQSQPVMRTNPASDQHAAEVKPQSCYCINPNGSGATWWCEIGRELWNSTIGC